jgi:hypothetical protein
LGFEYIKHLVLESRETRTRELFDAKLGMRQSALSRIFSRHAHKSRFEKGGSRETRSFGDSTHQNAAIDPKIVTKRPLRAVA